MFKNKKTALLISFTLLASTLLGGCTQLLDDMLLSLADRPQNPKERPYIIKEVVIPGGEAGVKLAGELTMPAGNGRFPAIVMLTGSGALNRDQEIAKHKPFLVIADYLPKRGYAVLRCDDRGVGGSTGDFDAATTLDFARDGAAMMRWLRRQKHIDSRKVGYLGHSEGGIKAPLAAMQESADFMILLAAPAIALDKTLIQQQIDIAMAMGKTPAEINQGKQVIQGLFATVKSDRSPEEIQKVMPDSLKGISIKWFKWLLNHDPRASLTAFDKPVLALYGEKDTQVSALTSAPVMQSTFSHKASKVITFPGLNHFFQPAKKGTVEEMAWIDITIDEKVLKSMLDWLDSLDLN